MSTQRKIENFIKPGHFPEIDEAYQLLEIAEKCLSSASNMIESSINRKSDYKKLKSNLYTASSATHFVKGELADLVGDIKSSNYRNSR